MSEARNSLGALATQSAIHVQYSTLCNVYTVIKVLNMGFFGLARQKGSLYFLLSNKSGENPHFFIKVIRRKAKINTFEKEKNVFPFLSCMAPEQKPSRKKRSP